ncbi:4,5-dihydroxyphthalate decarboxylase [Marmoricola endophyticus]|uniref:4,5-dihydroxyphthalate decarboxylase n=1 Tax=Marmoricola endophyticus TaxID=2040280 RepID=A0A917BNF5_9ACTN|nr:4,5-dihydroxyphthalate decarboxylase [Marmoricola endophyticus]GGF49904.1 4,5-dihydroxyphthalate decarboxylase [Marmoricola endophyticus]
MSDRTLRIGTFDYDTTHALLDGSVRLETDGLDGVGGTEVRTYPTLPDVFEAFIDGETDVSELGLTFLLRAIEAGAPYVALPIFPNRVFRHSSLFVNAASGIESPADLVGRTIGEFRLFGQDSGVWAKGILADEYGVRPQDSRWVIAGLDRPASPFGFTTHPVPDDVDLTVVEDRSLDEMLLSGEIDALVTANVPPSALEGRPEVRRLFPDYPAVERDWYERTRLFPIMHTVAVRRDLLEELPGLARAAYDAFSAAKKQAADRYRRMRLLYQVTTMLPWANDLMDRDLALLGEDWWPYGITANRSELETYLRYHHEQGLSRQWSVEELFEPGLLDS